MRTRPFLRTSEFLWQEGHTAHSSAEDAVLTATEMIDMYASVCQDLLAIPTVKGRKSPSERFAGADDTFTIEALMQNGWALQSGTSHFLGQNFARAFDVYFQTENNSRELVWATSWGVSTRLIGAMIMTHSDDKGLVLPPPVAPLQVVIVPITKGSGEDHDAVMQKVDSLAAELKKAKVRVKVDDRLNVRPGAKYFEWERKGLPIRIEIGPRDLKGNSATMALRHTGEKIELNIAEGSNVAGAVQSALTDMHAALLSAAQQRLAQKTFKLTSYEEMKKMILSAKAENTSEDASGTASDEKASSAGFYLVPWKCDAKNEETIKDDCKATIRCYPFELNGPGKSPEPGVKCFFSGEPATHWAIFARAF